ncbi:uncharacterized protein L969DRAFT_51053 [Mixia osmundae IAM 14324]|uniref:Uncharacterized protein n=1 Tax=Mixia osmundae (strain CBS 9802 / IAM 14324 / JCM 22182 / KY 12970) TaxID=764103 RepID=G7DZ36_MIXOS|nr:uncharacterized protein L969DRAFT_51053 [Mixia osmundae IAM 14324]KEI38247.1 hypothetical protein L969DRAFT_51053 [Mixia osmundae IAM 14324]GAA95846.1 hypothetical protein E5Q_02503 [Mixia osmundae IAM 14324]
MSAHLAACVQDYLVNMLNLANQDAIETTLAIAWCEGDRKAGLGCTEAQPTVTRWLTLVLHDGRDHAEHKTLAHLYHHHPHPASVPDLKVAPSLYGRTKGGTRFSLRTASDDLADHPYSQAQRGEEATRVIEQ